ncbi:MAG: hypothetical protein II563_09055 [Treponema sp.]|nr:hypothetical protein [Treponema sp.]
MKNTVKFGIAGTLILALSLIISCGNYVDNLTLAGYTYKMTDLTKPRETTNSSGHNTAGTSEVLVEAFVANSTDNPIKFGKNGTSVTWTIDGREHHGTYSVDMNDNSVTLNVTGQYLNGSYKFTYTNRGKKLRSPDFESFDDELDDEEIAYPASEGPYHLIYTLE